MKFFTYWFLHFNILGEQVTDHLNWVPKPLSANLSFCELIASTLLNDTFVVTKQYLNILNWGTKVQNIQFDKSEMSGDKSDKHCTTTSEKMSVLKPIDMIWLINVHLHNRKNAIILLWFSEQMRSHVYNTNLDETVTKSAVICHQFIKHFGFLFVIQTSSIYRILDLG